MTMTFFLVIILVLAYVLHVTHGAECDAKSDNDVTRPGTKGSDVVKEATKRIRDAGIFPDDHGFLERIAQVESKCGDDPNTYKNKKGKPYHGGIWQVDEGTFKETQNTKNYQTLKEKMAKIKDKLGIDWKKVKWSDLRCPLYSAIAARLYLSVITEDPIPKDLQGQAEYWKKWYNTEKGKGTVEKFVKEADLKGDPHVCEEVQGSDKQLCYMFHGSNGDIYGYILDPAVDNLRVTGTMKGDGKFALFTGEVTISSNSVLVDVTLDGVTIDGGFHEWGEEATYDRGQAQIRLMKNQLEADYNLMVVRVILKGKHLDVTLDRVTAFSQDASGILGAVATGVEIEEDNIGAQLVIKATGEHIRLNPTQDGWEVPRREDHAPGFYKIIHDQCISCSGNQ